MLNVIIIIICNNSSLIYQYIILCGKSSCVCRILAVGKNYLFESNMNEILILQITSPNLNFYHTTLIQSNINSINIIGKCCLSPIILKETEFVEKFPSPKFVEIAISQSRDINRIILSCVRNYRLLLQRQLRTEDHVEDPRVRNANCNYGRACAHDILHPWSLSILCFSRSAFFVFSLSFSLVLFLLSAASTRESYVWTCIYNAHCSAARTCAWSSL